MRKELIFNFVFFLVTFSIIVSIWLIVKGYRPVATDGINFSHLDQIVTVQQTGVLHIDSFIPIGKISLNGKVFSLDDNYLSGVKPGKYNLVVELENYNKFISDVEIQEDRVTRIIPLLLPLENGKLAYNNFLEVKSNEKVLYTSYYQNELYIFIQDTFSKKLILKVLKFNNNPISELIFPVDINSIEILELGTFDILGSFFSNSTIDDVVITNKYSSLENFLAIQTKSKEYIFDLDSKRLVDISKFAGKDKYIASYFLADYLTIFDKSTARLDLFKMNIGDLVLGDTPTYSLENVSNVGEYNGIIYFLKERSLFLLSINSSNKIVSISYDTPQTNNLDSSFQFFIQKDLERFVLWSKGGFTYFDKYFNVISNFKSEAIEKVVGNVGQYKDLADNIFVLNPKTDLFERSDVFSGKNCMYIPFAKNYCISKNSGSYGFTIPGNDSIPLENVKDIWVGKDNKFLVRRVVGEKEFFGIVADKVK